MYELTGIRLKISSTPAPLRVQLQAAKLPSTKTGTDQPDAHASPAANISDLAGQTYGHNHQTAPICYADDPKAIVLGSLADGKAGLVIQDHGTWTAVYSAAPLLPAPLLRHLAQLAGVHLYIDTEDVVWASHDIVAVSVLRTGSRTIQLPRPANVSDLYQATEIGQNIRSFKAEFPERGTRVFVLR